MCGICGVVLKEGADPAWAAPDLVLAMRERLAHRGPDDAGVWVDSERGVALAHRRLSILDLSTRARQPMVDPESGSRLVTNGEIYNFRELRRELAGGGRIFRSESDTEVLLAGLVGRGPDFLGGVVGMFAFAFWDPRRRSLLLARDRLGKKPLYYHDGPRLFAFASEPAALLAHPAVVATVDRQAVAAYMTLGYIPAPRTGWVGISKLPPAHLAELAGGRLALSRYWTIPTERADLSDEGWVERIRAAVGIAVRDRLVADVQVGTYLSGGVDSTIVSLLARRDLGESLTTFVAGYEVGERSAKYNVDLEAARGVARSRRVRLVERILRGADQAFEALPVVARHLGEPNDNPAGVATYLLAESIRAEGIPVVLSGDGADELFAGYDRYRRDRWLGALARAGGKALGRIAGAHRARGGRITRTLARAALAPPERYLSWWRIFDEDEIERLLGIRSTFAREAVGECLGEVPRGRWSDELPRADLALWIAEQSNARVDRLSMAHGVEVRAPFLDHRLVELAARIPFARRIGVASGKRLLKRAFADLLPAEVLERPKWGWLPPFYHWFQAWREEGRLDDLLSPDQIARTGLVDPDAARTLLDPSRPLPEVRLRLWNLLHLVLWHREVVATARRSDSPIEKRAVADAALAP